MTKPAAVALAALLLAGCASADRAQLADSITTAVAFTRGYTEANPVWGNADWPVIAAVKLGATQAIKYAPPEFCVPGLQSATVAGWAAAAWNLGVLLGCGPCVLPVAVAATVWLWDDWTRDAIKTCTNPVKFDFAQ